MELTFNIWPWDKKDAKPYFVNEENFEWWIDKETIEYCKQKKLDNLIVFVVRKDKNPLSRVIIHSKTNKILKESSSLESIAAWIDFYALSKGLK